MQQAETVEVKVLVAQEGSGLRGQRAAGQVLQEDSVHLIQVILQECLPPLQELPNAVHIALTGEAPQLPHNWAHLQPVN